MNLCLGGEFFANVGVGEAILSVKNRVESGSGAFQKERASQSKAAKILIGF